MGFALTNQEIFSASVLFQTFTDLPVTVVGKGPTFDRFRGQPRDSVVIGINQAAIACEAHVVVVTDLDVLDGDYLHRIKPTSLVILPWYPHYKNKPNIKLNLRALCKPQSLLQEVLVKGRLGSYRTDRVPFDWPGPSGPNWPRIRVRGFTGCAVLNLLFTSGIRSVSTAGIDGGTQYSEVFKDLTPLTNGQKSFAIQDREIALLRKRGMTINPL